MAACRCSDVTVLWDTEADEYTDHLVREHVRERAEVVTYRCPQTQRLWAAEFVPDDAGGSALRLTRLMHAAELVERLAQDTDPAAWLAYAHPEIEFRPIGSDTTYRGIAEAERWAGRVATDPRHPVGAVVSLVEAGADEVVVLGTITQRTDTHSEHQPAAWLVTVREGRILRSLWFESWEKARHAAGLPSEGGPEPRRVGGWSLAVAGAWSTVRRAALTARCSAAAGA